MSNMSYCRFQNTLRDLISCREALDEIGGDISQLTQDEARAANAFVRVCQYISMEYAAITLSEECCAMTHELRTDRLGSSDLPEPSDGVVAWRWRNSVGDITTAWIDFKTTKREAISNQVTEAGGTIEYAYTAPQVSDPVGSGKAVNQNVATAIIHALNNNRFGQKTTPQDEAVIRRALANCKSLYTAPPCLQDAAAWSNDQIRWAANMSWSDDGAGNETVCLSPSMFARSVRRCVSVLCASQRSLASGIELQRLADHQTTIGGDSIDDDIRELSKWLNEDSTAPINRQALARMLFKISALKDGSA